MIREQAGLSNFSPLRTDDLRGGGAAKRASARYLLVPLCLLLLAGCAGLRRKDLDHAEALAAAARSTAIDCNRIDACAQASPLRALGDRAVVESTPNKPVNYVEIVGSGQDSLLGRINLIRSARSSIDLQTFILSQDDTGYLFFNELLAAARRGVKVRVLADQLFGPTDVGLLANLAAAHANFQMRLYNPTFGYAHTSKLQYIGAISCCFRRFNQRMHTKLLIVDGQVGITGGRNIDDRYFDWNPDFDFLDRDAILAGPEVASMEREFNLFWINKRSVPLARLKDVARQLLAHGGPPPHMPITQERRSPRVLAMIATASDQSEVSERLVEDARPVAEAHFIADGPRKHEQELPEGGVTTQDLRELIEGAQTSVLIQTPYLVLSKGAREMFKAMHHRPDAPQVTISTNSLASTDAYPAYALSYKYKRRYLHVYGFHLFELKPYPLDVPIDEIAAGALDRNQSTVSLESEDDPSDKDQKKPRLRVPSESLRFPGMSRGGKPVPLREAGLRVSLHSKSMVIDSRIGIIGSHNFDPRSDHYNTEGLLVFDDPVMAQRLQADIERDIAPVNSWLVAKRPHTPVSRLNANINRLFETLPIFDLWPFRYATSYELKPGCDPVPPKDPRFHQCWVSVGDFPETEISLKAFYTRVITAFGAGLAPIL